MVSILSGPEKLNGTNSNFTCSFSAVFFTSHYLLALRSKRVSFKKNAKGIGTKDLQISLLQKIFYVHIRITRTNLTRNTYRMSLPIYSRIYVAMFSNFQITNSYSAVVENYFNSTLNINLLIK